MSERDDYSDLSTRWPRWVRLLLALLVCAALVGSARAAVAWLLPRPTGDVLSGDW